jgi:type I restriction enzyme S subunit
MINGLNLNFDFVTQRVALVKDKGAITSAYMAIKANDCNEILPEYSTYLLKIYDNCKAFHNMGGGVRKILNFDELRRSYIIVPPVDEQKKISKFLDAKCSEIDDLIADIRAQIKILEQYKKSTISEAVTEGIDPNATMKDSGYEWIGETPAVWQFIKGKYLFAQRTSKGNNIELQLLSPSQKFGVVPQTLLEELTTQNVVKVKEDTDLSTFKTIHVGDFCISLRSFQGGFVRYILGNLYG